MGKVKGIVIIIILILIAGSVVYLKSSIVPPGEKKFEVMAKRFSYGPNIIEVNKGDKVTIRFISEDVHHGFYLDGYELETNARPGEDGIITFIAEKSGKFSFRCSITCGPFHPYMIGYLKVKPDYRLFVAFLISVAIFGFSIMYLFRKTDEGNKTDRDVVV